MPPRRVNYYELKIKPNLDLIKRWKIDGYTNNDICKELEIGKTTFYKYSSKKDRYGNENKDYKEDFAKLLIVCKQKFDTKLENVMYKEACGYETTETRVEIKETPQGIEKKQSKITKWNRPSVTLLMFVVCNRMPGKWKKIDKELAEAIEEGRVELNITDKNIQDAFKALYPAIKNEKDDDKEDES